MSGGLFPLADRQNFFFAKPAPSAPSETRASRGVAKTCSDARAGGGTQHVCRTMRGGRWGPPKRPQAGARRDTPRKFFVRFFEKIVFLRALMVPKPEPMAFPMHLRPGAHQNAFREVSGCVFYGLRVLAGAWRRFCTNQNRKIVKKHAKRAQNAKIHIFFTRGHRHSRDHFLVPPRKGP